MSLKISNRAIVFSTIEGWVTTAVAFAVVLPSHKWLSIPISLLKWFLDFLIGYSLSAYLNRYGIAAKFYHREQSECDCDTIPCNCPGCGPYGCSRCRGE